MNPAERVYRFALRAYPRVYRRERGDEIVATILECDSGVRGREIVSLVFEGVARRGRLADAGSSTTATRAGLRLGAFALLWLSAVVSVTWALNPYLLTGFLGAVGGPPVWPGLGTAVAAIVSLWAVALGWWAGPLVLQLVWQTVIALALGHGAMTSAFGGGGPVDRRTTAVWLIGLAPALLMLLARPRASEPADRRSWRWSVAAVALGALISWQDLFFTSWLGRPLAVVLVAWLIVGRRDLRLAVGGAVAAAGPAAAVFVYRYSVPWISPEQWVAYTLLSLAAVSVVVGLSASRER